MSSTQLLAKGANVNARAARGQTALMWAVAQQHPDVVKVLLSHRADVNARSESWRQMEAVSPHGAPEYNREIPYGNNTPLMFAARVGDLASAKLLVAAGANVNDQDAWGISVVTLAAHSGFLDLVEFLLDKGADPNTSGRRLYRASRGDHAPRRAAGSNAARAWRRPARASPDVDTDATAVERPALRARTGGRHTVLARRTLLSAERDAPARRARRRSALRPSQRSHRRRQGRPRLRPQDSKRRRR